MNNFQKMLARLIVLARAMSPQSRMVAALVLVLIVLSGAYLLNVGANGDRVDLFGDSLLPANQLNSMQAAFAQAGLNEAVVENERIRVPRGQQSKYFGALADANALPHNFGDSLRKMLEANSFLTDKRKREEMMKVAMQDELSRIVCKMEVVEWATVMYDVQPASFANHKREVRPCVTVKPRGQGALSLEQVQRIRNVVGPPLGAAPQEVTLVDLQGATYPAGSDENSHAPSFDLYAPTQHEFERLYKDKLQTALAFVPGAMVTVNVELHSEVEDSAQSIKIDPKKKADDRSQDREHPHAPAALDALRRIEFGGANSPAAIDLSNADGYETRHVKRAGLTPKRVTVSVAVPGSYFAQVWRERNGKPNRAEPKTDELAPIEQEIRTKIEQHVARVVPVPEGQDRQLASLVTVTAFPQMPTAPVSEPIPSEIALAWLENHSGLVVAVVSCCLGLLMLRSIVRSAVRTSEVATDSPPHEEFDEPHDLPKAPNYVRPRRRTVAGPAVREELSDIVRDDPNAAASVLRNWIGSSN